MAMCEMSDGDRKAIERCIDCINEYGQPAFDYMIELLKLPDNEEALTWMVDIEANLNHED